MPIRLMIAAAAGVALSFAYAPHGLWWLAPLAIAALTASAINRSAKAGFLLGWVFGLGFFLPLLSWLGAVIGRDAGIGLAVYSALWIGLAGLGTALVTRLPVWPLWVASVWVLQEAISSRFPLGGWGWGRVGFAADGAIYLPWASVAGVPGLTFLTVLIAATGVWLARNPEPTRLLGAAVVAGLVAVAALIPVPTESESIAGPATRNVGLVQGNVPQAGLDFNAQRQAVLNNHVQGTFRLAAAVAAGQYPEPDFVLWPENASDIDPFTNASANDAITSATRAVGVPILVGAVVEDPDDDRIVYNQGIVWDPVTGPGQRYTKRNLVPFGEYVPFRSLLAPLISRFDRIPRDFVPGSEPGGMDIGGTRIGNAICFDVAYDDAFRSATRDGGRMLVVQTNNATYNGTEQPEQQLAMSRIRAVEHGRAIAVVSTSGLSAVISPDGSLVADTFIGEGVADEYVVTIPQRDSLTVADQLGAGPEWAVALIGLGAMILGARRPVAEVTADDVTSTSKPGTTSVPERPLEKEHDDHA